MLTDLRLAVRAMWRAPAFALSAILTLALGVGANTGAFSALHTLLLKPLPYPEPERLVALYETTIDQKPRGVAEGNLLDWRARTNSFEAMAVYQPRSFGLTLSDRDVVNVIQTGMVMSELFRVLRVPPAIGRTFREDEEFAEAHLVVLTDRLWRTKFASDRDVIGRKVYLNEEPHAVVGVMPPGFEFPMGSILPDAYIPLSHKDYCCGRVGSQSAIARLSVGASPAVARSQLEAAARTLTAEYPQTNGGRSAGLQPLDEVLTGNRREPLMLLVSAALLLLAIACANVAGLMMARCLGRSHEMAIRASLGAGVGRIARQFFAEAAVVSVAGAACGLFAAALVLRVVTQFVPGAGIAEPLRLEGGAFAAALALAMLVTILLAAAPTVLMRNGNLSALIKAGGRQSSRGSRSGVRGALVMAQIALSVVLLLNTGLLLRSFFRLMVTSPGFETAHALEFGIGLPEKRYDTSRKEIAYHEALTRKLAEVPGVESVGAVSRLPLRGSVGLGAFQIWGSNLPVPQWPRSGVNVATPGYFAAMGIPVVEGRDFSWRDDRPQVHRVAIVNLAFVRAYLRERRVLGTLLDVRWISDLNKAGVTWEIVGVAGDTRQADLERDPVPEIFLSVSQVGMDGGGYVIRTRRADAGISQAIAKVVEDQDPRMERARVKSLDFVVERAMGSRRAAVRLVGGFGVIALLLTAVGVYGIVAFRAAERAREMAIRTAFGATRAEIRNLVLGHGLRLVAGGTAIGLALFRMTSGWWKGQLFGVGTVDPVSIGGVIAVVLVVTIGASIGPSRRASRAVPADLLRDS